MLSVVTEPDGDAIYIHVDTAGVAKLEQLVAFLKKGLAAGDCPHDHMHSAAWGGEELSESMLEQERTQGFRQVHQLKVYGWTDEWAIKHGLRKL